MNFVFQQSVTMNYDFFHYFYNGSSTWYMTKFLMVRYFYFDKTNTYQMTHEWIVCINCTGLNA